MSLAIRAGRVFTGSTLIEGGVLVTDGPRVAGVLPDAPVDVALDDCTLVPGFVDAHCHGGGGASFSADPGAVLALHRAHGTTSSVASLVSQSLDTLEEQVRALSPLVRAGELVGIHLEGPWLSPARKGAHPVEALRAPAASEVRRLLDAGDGTVVMVTIAPELDGGLDAVALVAGRGIVAAVGHTDASYEVVREAIARGARGATHLFNAMPPLLHRAPGPILALLDDDRVWLELICDGVHVDLDLVRYVVAGQPGRAVLITDAMAAAGCADGDYQLGDLPVEVCCGVARIAGQDTIAGSTLTLDAALRHAIASGVDWTTAVRALTLNPAAYLGLSDVGSLAAGHWADAVALDADWNVRAVLRRGDWLVEPT
ncbi:MAG TPA: N-acetylglucosamine-6-phosphate deacetylase [Propioniciclava tarda]|nr:N-acetylglucosamine-6-phosphate deacetylase [Propioniciclava tarda]